MEPHRTGRNEPKFRTLEPGRTLGPYLVLSTLSVGPRSAIYKAQDLALDRPVALKTAPRGALSVVNEGHVLAHFSHPHIVTLHGLWTQPQALVLEYLDGETLKARHNRCKVLPADTVRAWLTDILSALETVHEHDMAHGAVRAENIFLTTDQRIKLLDFRQSGGGETPIAPTDDIRALGRLILDLTDPESDKKLRDLAQGATLGHFPTVRALRTALTSPVRSATKIITVPAAPPPPEVITLPPAEPLTADDFAVAINPMIPLFYEDKPHGSIGAKRIGVATLVLLAALAATALLSWAPHARPMNTHTTRTAQHVAAPQAARITPGGATKRAKPPPAAGRTTAAIHRTVVHPKNRPTPSTLGAYAALAHAWGG